jgi:hypothetical protein
MSGGWERVKPQWVRHADGYEVYSNGRFRIAYEDVRGKALIAAEQLMGAVQISAVDIVWEAADGSTTPVPADDRALVLQRTVDGLTFMGAHPMVTPDRGTS